MSWPKTINLGRLCIVMMPGPYFNKPLGFHSTDISTWSYSGTYLFACWYRTPGRIKEEIDKRVRKMVEERYRGRGIG